jgi:hypothetical protein
MDRNPENQFLSIFPCLRCCPLKGISDHIFLSESPAADECGRGIAKFRSPQKHGSQPASARADSHRRPAADSNPGWRASPLSDGSSGAGKAGVRPGRIYCLPCRAPKVPAGKISDTIRSLQGICPDCNRIIFRRVNPQKLAAVHGDLDSRSHGRERA